SECLRVPEAEFRCAVAHNDALSVLRQTPALPRIAELAATCEAGQVVNESGLRPPGDFQQPVLPIDDSFAEILLANLVFFQNLAGFQPDLPNRGAPVQPRPFIEEAVQIKQPLRVGQRVVWVNMDNLIAVFGNAAGLGSRSAAESRERGDRYQDSHNHCPAYRESHVSRGTLPGAH